MWIHNSPETARLAGDGHRSYSFNGDDDHDRDSSSSSSIGNNSDSSAGGGGGSGGGSEDDSGEVQSLFRGSLNNLADLEEALVIKRGISTFYSGKSKSYTSLADAVSAPSIQDIVKPEDAYNRKRKNMLAHSIILNKNPNFNSIPNTGIPKKVANANNADGESSSPSGSGSLPPLPARNRIIPPINESLNLKSSPRNHCSPWRSYSLSDLQHAAAGGGGGAASSFMGNKRDEDD